MRQPFLLEFRNLVTQGAGVQDIHDAQSVAGYATVSRARREQFLEREVARVAVHQNATCALLENFLPRATRILDVGCGTGAATVALALSGKLRPHEVVGVDASELSVAAARVRAAGHDILPKHIRFEHVAAGNALPFKDGAFDLVVCISVFEFISTVAGREFLASEMLRVTRPAGHIFLSTPSRLRYREFHSRRPLGNFVRQDGFPWSSSERSIRRMFGGAHLIPTSSFRLRPYAGAMTGMIAPIVKSLLPWQKLLFQK